MVSWGRSLAEVLLCRGGRFFLGQGPAFGFRRPRQDEQAQHKARFRYILALVLMRKKILRFADILREDGKEYLILRYPREKRDFKVLDPGLTEEEADTVKEDLAQILNVNV